jgi:hypothetical protein
MIERLVQHERMQGMRFAPGFRLGKIEVIMLFCLGALNILCALCVFGAMHVLAYGLE